MTKFKIRYGDPSSITTDHVEGDAVSVEPSSSGGNRKVSVYTTDREGEVDDVIYSMTVGPSHALGYEVVGE